MFNDSIYNGVIHTAKMFKNDHNLKKPSKTRS